VVGLERAISGLDGSSQFAPAKFLMWWLQIKMCQYGWKIRRQGYEFNSSIEFDILTVQAESRSQLTVPTIFS
jgi:hypothetical protein